MKCPNCQAEINDSAKFCPECGQKVNEKRICSRCGTELSATSKFCPECGTPYEAKANTPVHVEAEEVAEAPRKDLLFLTQKNLDELIGDEYRLVSIDSVNSTKESIVEVGIDDDGDVVAVGIKRGTAQMMVDFTYRPIKNKQQFTATLVAKLVVKSGNEIEVKEYEFVNVNDEEGEDSDDTWKTIGSIAKGAATVIGGIGLGLLDAWANSNDDDEY